MLLYVLCRVIVLVTQNGGKTMNFRFSNDGKKNDNPSKTWHSFKLTPEEVSGILEGSLTEIVQTAGTLGVKKVDGYEVVFVLEGKEHTRILKTKEQKRSKPRVKIFFFMEFLGQPRTMKEMSEFLGLTERRPYDYIADLKVGGVPVYHRKGDDGVGRYCLYESGQAPTRIVGIVEVSLTTMPRHLLLVNDKIVAMDNVASVILSKIHIGYVLIELFVDCTSLDRKNEEIEIVRLDVVKLFRDESGCELIELAISREIVS